MQKIRPDMDIGHNIQRLRRNANMTQEQVVAHLQLMGIEISKSTYAKLETNRMNIKVSELVALSKILMLISPNSFPDCCKLFTANHAITARTVNAISKLLIID